MGHRHMFNTPQIFETDNDQGWNYVEQPYMPIARGAPESSSTVHPVDNMTIQSAHFPSQWTPTSRSNGYSSILNTELPHYQPMAPGPSCDPFLHQPGAGNVHMHQDAHSHHPSSSNMGGQTAPGADSGFYDQAIVSGRGPYKRKSPSIPPMCERGSTSSRYYDVGSSSDIHLPEDPWQGKQNAESYHTHWEYPPSHGVNNSLSIGSEGTSRNVRSRSAVDLETNLARTHLSSNPVHSLSSQTSDQSTLGDFWGQSSNPPREWSRNLVSPASHGVTPGSGTSFFSQDPNSLNTLNSHPNSSLEMGVFNNDVTMNRNHIRQNVNSHLNQPSRGVRSGYGQRSVPTFRASSSNFRPGHLAPIDDGQQMNAENYPSRHPRPASNFRWRNVDRIGRTYAASERYRSFSEEASFRDRLTPEGIMVGDHPPFYGSRALFDQHRDMRLDIDSMSYEELLALGERIGSVSTGLSDGLISKSLTESIYCSSDLCEDEGTCVICLEEYKNMDDVGTLKVCGHDFHVGCIRKWLSMKNMCPICKAAAVDDSVNEK